MTLSNDHPPETSQVPFTPVTAEALDRLTPAERDSFTMAAEQVACSQKPSMMTIVALIETIQRQITEPTPADAATAKLAEIETHALTIRRALKHAWLYTTHVEAADELTAALKAMGGSDEAMEAGRG